MANKQYPGDPNWIESLRKMHPFKLAIYVAIIGICVMFLFINLGFMLTKSSHNLLISKWFTVSSILILFSSFVANQFKILFKKDKVHNLLSFYYLSFVLGVCFGITQFLGWKSMFLQGFTFGNSDISYTYIYLLSGLHLLHFVGGMGYLIYLIIKTLKAKNDIVVRLVFSTDPYEYMLIELLTIYWHFMAILWFVLYFSFLLA